MTVLKIDTMTDPQQLYESSSGLKKNVLLILGSLLESQYYSKAKELLDIACQRNQNQSWPYIFLVLLYHEMGKPREAANISAQLIKSIKKSPQEIQNSQSLAVLEALSAASKGNHQKGLNGLKQLAVALHPYPRKILSSSVKCELGFEPFKEKITQALREQDGNQCKTKIQEHVSSIEVLSKDELKQKKFLGVFRHHAYAMENARVVEFFDFYARTAKEFGVNYRAFPSDVFVHFNSFTTEEFKQEVLKLKHEIEEWQPDFVYIDNFLYHDDEYMQAFVSQHLQDLKDRFGVKFIAFYADAWHFKQKHMIENHAGLADAIHHTHSTYLGTLKQDIEDKTFCFPCPYPKDIFHQEAVGKDIFAAFHGSLHDLRSPWLVRMKEKKLNAEIIISNHNKNNHFSSTEDFARQIARYQVSIIFSARNFAQTAITGSIWEALLSESLILEEKSAEVKDFLVPFAHYIPFENFAELSAYLEYLEKDPSLVYNISQAAINFFEQNYTSDHFWQLLMSKADAC